jgi:uncharacterized protein (TIGR03000 family)
MIRIHFCTLAAVVLLTAAADRVHGWGRGGFGGFRAGGFSAGGISARGFSAGGFRAGDVGGFRAGNVGGFRAGDVGGFRAGNVGGFRAGDVGGLRAGNVGVAGTHINMATDFGFGHVGAVAGARGFVGAGHYTTRYAGGVLAARGVAVRGGFYHYGAFNSGWWTSHPAAWRPYGWNAAYPWRVATWPALIGWFGWSAPPIYYDYGNTIVYQGDQVFIDGQPGPTAAEYYDQAAELAESAPPAPPPDKKQDEWQPLGVFSLVQGEQSDTSAVFQLAVNKAGIIRGNYYNVLTDNTLPVRGAVDKKTQRASWIVGDQKTTVYDTGIDNLTRDQCPLLIHFGKERTQQWLLVRIEEKDSKAPEAAPDTAPPPPSEGTTARLTLVVPADADVFFDGTLMTETGSTRHYITPPLAEGQGYNYSIRARWTQDGMPVEQTRSVPFKAGANVRVDFTSPLP